ncbi:MAG: UDP-N-acetylglucosamine 2-epimerase (non-hydrolyzing) [Planctomycetota bacterium]
MIAVVAGTRPEIIKVAPVLRRLKGDGLPYAFLHTNQHYSKEMDADILADLRLDPPDRNFGIGSLSHAAQTGRAMEGLEAWFIEHRPSIVLVHGDTNTTLAGAVAAKKLNIPVGHIEAGLRSFDQKMPEEINRMLVDRISDVHFAPTQIARENLLREGTPEESIEVCGNTVVDALHDHAALAEDSTIHRRLGLADRRYILSTLHRAENVDSRDSLAAMLHLLEHAGQRLDAPMLLPLHPRTRKNIAGFELKVPDNVQVLDPVGYIDMLALLMRASLVMTDSGGIQEEAYVLRRPLVTLRDSTERPETLKANFLVKSDITAFDRAWDAYLAGQPSWDDSFGDGRSAERIVDRLTQYL